MANLTWSSRVEYDNCTGSNNWVTVEPSSGVAGDKPSINVSPATSPSDCKSATVYISASTGSEISIPVVRCVPTGSNCDDAAFVDNINERQFEYSAYTHIEVGSFNKDLADKVSLTANGFILEGITKDSANGKFYANIKENTGTSTLTDYYTFYYDGNICKESSITQKPQEDECQSETCDDITVSWDNMPNDGIPCEGGNYTYTITKSDCWNLTDVSCSDTWISVNTGNSTVSFTQYNYINDNGNRNGTISFKFESLYQTCDDIKLTASQKQCGAPCKDCSTYGNNVLREIQNEVISNSEKTGLLVAAYKNNISDFTSTTVSISEGNDFATLQSTSTTWSEDSSYNEIKVNLTNNTGTSRTFKAKVEYGRECGEICAYELEFEQSCTCSDLSLIPQTALTTSCVSGNTTVGSFTGNCDSLTLESTAPSWLTGRISGYGIIINYNENTGVEREGEVTLSINGEVCKKYHMTQEEYVAPADCPITGQVYMAYTHELPADGGLYSGPVIFNTGNTAFTSINSVEGDGSIITAITWGNDTTVGFPGTELVLHCSKNTGSTTKSGGTVTIVMNRVGGGTCTYTDNGFRQHSAESAKKAKIIVHTRGNVNIFPSFSFSTGNEVMLSVNGANVGTGATTTIEPTWVELRRTINKVKIFGGGYTGTSWGSISIGETWNENTGTISDTLLVSRESYNPNGFTFCFNGCDGNVHNTFDNSDYAGGTNEIHVLFENET